MPEDTTGLTDRERDILRLMAAGRTNSEIAQELGLSFWTAKWYVSEILSKTGAASREEAASAWKRHRTERRYARLSLPWLAASLGAGATMIGAGAAFSAVTNTPPPFGSAPSPPAPPLVRIQEVSPEAGTVLAHWSPANLASEPPAGICLRFASDAGPGSPLETSIRVDGIEIAGEGYAVGSEGTVFSTCFDLDGFADPIGVHDVQVRILDHISGAEYAERHWTFEVAEP